MKKLIAIQREKVELLGRVEFLDNGVRKFARFDKKWTDEQVCRNFGITPPKAAKDPQ